LLPIPIERQQDFFESKSIFIERVGCVAAMQFCSTSFNQETGMSIITGHLALVVGHDKIRQGAHGVAPISSSEYVYNSHLAKLIEEYGERRGHQVDIFFRDHIGIKGAYKSVADAEPDACIELHFNAFNGAVRGTETLFADIHDEKEVMEKEFAQCVQDEICKLFQRDAETNRGLINRSLSKGERGYMNVSQLFNIPSILIEPFFGDNPDDAQLAVSWKQPLAEAIVHAFEAWKTLVGKAKGYIV
jgi:N-acetylmuramoyl-L-alanine amidase